jgi:hypothetical protein
VLVGLACILVVHAPCQSVGACGFLCKTYWLRLEREYVYQMTKSTQKCSRHNSDGQGERTTNVTIMNIDSPAMARLVHDHVLTRVLRHVMLEVGDPLAMWGVGFTL